MVYSPIWIFISMLRTEPKSLIQVTAEGRNTLLRRSGLPELTFYEPVVGSTRRRPLRSLAQFRRPHSLRPCRQSPDGANFTVLSDVAANVTSQSLTAQADGTHYYRVRALTPGQIGYYVTPPSAPQNITVNHRSLMDITNQVKTAISNVSLTGGVFSLDLTMTNQSNTTYVPYVKLNIIGITSGSGTVRVSNA